MKSDRNYVYTERAHFMCPDMHFGIMAKIERNYDERQLRQSIDALQKAHPFLQSLIAEETDTGRIYYQMQDYLNIPVIVKKEDILCILIGDMKLSFFIIFFICPYVFPQGGTFSAGVIVRYC